MKTRITTLPLLALLLLPLSLSATTIHHRPAPTMSAKLEVTNVDREPVNVLLMDGAGWYILGMVPKWSSETFAVPTELVGRSDVTVLAAPRDDLKDFAAAPRSVVAGEELRLVVEQPVARSQIAFK